jgi:hypothetical protein
MTDKHSDMLSADGKRTMERPVKVTNPVDGKIVDGVEVAVLESTERWTDIKLEDGSFVRVKPSIMSAVRIPGQFDQEGNPMYMLRAANAMMVSEAPEHLKKAAFDAAKKGKAN